MANIIHPRNLIQTAMEKIAALPDSEENDRLYVELRSLLGVLPEKVNTEGLRLKQIAGPN